MQQGKQHSALPQRVHIDLRSEGVNGYACLQELANIQLAKETALTTPDPSRVIASLARDRVNLDLKTVDLCFLAGLYLRANNRALASFEEDMLVDMFEQVCDVVEPGADNPRKRATHAIQRLREQRPE